jgi:hypothetical protein
MKAGKATGLKYFSAALRNISDSTLGWPGNA